MVLKYYDSKNDSFKELELDKSNNIEADVTSQSITQDGSTEEHVVHHETAESCLDAKISKEGDQLNGTLLLNNGAGLVGLKPLLYDEFSDARIEFKEGDSQGDSGYFRVTNIIKDFENPDDTMDTGSFNLVCDTLPTEDSENLLTSGAIYTALEALAQRVLILEQRL